MSDTGEQRSVLLNGTSLAVGLRVTGAQLRRLGNIPDHHEVFVEREGGDIPVSNSTLIQPTANDAIKIYTCPKATFGG